MIDSPSNRTVKALRSLHASRARREQRQFLVEGVRAIEDGIKAGFWPSVCLYNAEMLNRTERGQALMKTPVLGRGKLDVVAIEASPRALEAVSDTQHPQGIVAAFPFIERPAITEYTGRTGAASLGLVCDDVQDPGNLGTLLRAAEAAGVTSVWLTPRCVDAYSPKVVRAGMGVHFRLSLYPEREWDSIERDLHTLRVEASQVFASEMEAASSYDEVDWCAPSALIVSNETHGLSAEGKRLAKAGGSISIPMLGGTESLNAGIAGAIILFEAARQRRTRGKGQV